MPPSAVDCKRSLGGTLLTNECSKRNPIHGEGDTGGKQVDEDEIGALDEERDNDEEGGKCEGTNNDPAKKAMGRRRANAHPPAGAVARRLHGD